MTDNSQERLQKFLARAGIGSRRKAETFIERGLVTVNGVVATLGQKVNPLSDKVELDGQWMKPAEKEKKVYVINKPVGYASTHSTRHETHTVYQLLPDEDRDNPAMHCAGRLDKNSQGLLVISDDGDLTYALTHPSQKVLKHYRVVVNKPFPFDQAQLLIKGVEDEGEMLRAESVLPNPGDPYEMDICLNHGKKREIRRLLKLVGYKVVELERFQIGKYKLGDLPSGAVKRLTNEEKRLLLS